MDDVGAVFDGYALIRKLGTGGFGDVWVARSSVLGQLCALKLIRELGAAQRELAAVQQFKQLGLRHPGLISVEHVGALPPDGFFYVMPLADGIVAGDPLASSWKPLTLATRLAECRSAGGRWPSSNDIRSWLGGIARAGAALEEAGLVHRDIKPDNILFVRGKPVLSDVSLLAEDRTGLTDRGTPGYQAPSWFTDTGGNPDAYGLAATLYTALTGNSPDKMGRAAYRWPPGGESSLDAAEREEWSRLHRVIFRATHEKASERFRTLAEFASAIEKPGPQLSGTGRWASGRRKWVLVGGGAIVAAMGGGLLSRLWPSIHDDDSKPGKNPVSLNPWSKFDGLLAQAEQETGTIEREWQTLRENVRQELRLLKDAQGLAEVEAVVSRMAPVFSKLDDLEFDRVDALIARWLAEGLSVAWRDGVEADSRAEGWKAAERRKLQITALEARFTQMKKEEFPLYVAWKATVIAHLESLKATTATPEDKARVLALLEKTSPKYKIEKRLKDSARKNETATAGPAR